MRAEDPFDRFVGAARALLGARWRHRGRKPWAVDCIGLLVLAGEAVGIEIRAPKVYGREPWDDQLRQGLRDHFGEPVAGPYQPGDVALIRWGVGEPSHVAILADGAHGVLTMIHAHNLHGVVEHRLDGPFLKVIEEVYRPCLGR
jgi:hypothetical protein